MVEQGNPKTILVNGTNLTYIEQGAGEPVIFIHGSLGDYRAWNSQIEPFAQKYHVISYSRRYHYPNPWTGSGTDYNALLHAKDLLGFIEALDLGPVHVVGNSFGAYTALVAATNKPELLKKLVIGEPPILIWLKDIPGGGPYFEDFMQNTWMPAGDAFINGDLEQGVRLFIDGVSGKQGAFDHAPELARQRMLDNAKSLSAEMTSPGYFFDPGLDNVRKIQTPILLLHGENSPRMFHLLVDQIARIIPTALQATIPDASHSMPSNNPTVYNKVVMDFLG